VGLKDGAATKALFEKEFPMLAPHITDEDYELFAQKDISKLPVFSYCGPELHHKGAVLVGDAIHTVKPYFGLGVNAAFEVRPNGRSQTSITIWCTIL
jgi:kynurenine 3-monooxygenase